MKRRSSYQPRDITGGRAVMIIIGLTLIACALGAVIVSMGLAA